jgi:hypothetical protein
METDKTVAIIGCVSREGQQPLLQHATSVEGTKTVSRGGCVS